MVLFEVFLMEFTSFDVDLHLFPGMLPSGNHSAVRLGLGGQCYLKYIIHNLHQALPTNYTTLLQPTTHLLLTTNYHTVLRDLHFYYFL